MQAEPIAMNTISANGLIEKAKKGDEVAFNQLVNLWYKRINNYVLKYSSQEDTASDITQKTFISVFKNLKKLKESGSFKSWIYRIATNYCHEEARKQSRKKMVLMNPSHDEEEDQHLIESEAREKMFNPEQSFQQSELERILFDTLQELPEDHRSVILMKEYEGFKFHEIAETLDTSENTVKTRLYRGLKLLKRKLEEQNITKETIHYEL